MAPQKESYPHTNDETLKVTVTLPDEIMLGKPCIVKVDIRNVSSSAFIVNKRLSVGYKDSLSRELFIIIRKKGASLNIGLQKLLYERDFSPASDYVSLKPQEQISTQFNLFDWYEVPKARTLTIQVCYQADENLAYKPDGLVEGIFYGEKKEVTFKSF